MAAWQPLVDMELSDEEKLDTMMPMPMQRPDYPCGLKICLTGKELEKLGLAADCDCGDYLDIRAFACVASVTKNGDDCRVELQIEKMAIEEDEEGDDGASD